MMKLSIQVLWTTALLAQVTVYCISILKFNCEDYLPVDTDKEYYQPHHDTYINATPFKSRQVFLHTECLLECRAECNCMSVNIRPSNSTPNAIMCDLLEEDRISAPTKIVQQTGTVNYQKIFQPSCGECRPYKRESDNTEFCDCTKRRAAAVDCQAHKLYDPKSRTGAYKIQPPDKYPPLFVHCKILPRITNIVIQSNEHGSENFQRNWTEYQNGFGKISEDFWLGNDAIHRITNSGNYALHIRLHYANVEHGTKVQRYDVFKIGDASSKYKLGMQVSFTDAFEKHNGQTFKTAPSRCGTLHESGWWFIEEHGKKCFYSNLNGKQAESDNCDKNTSILWDISDSVTRCFSKATMDLIPGQ